MTLSLHGGSAAAFVELLEVLSRHPELMITSAADYLIVWPATPGSFEVMLRSAGWGRFQISFDGWRRTFPTLWEAGACFAFGFSANCRLRVTDRGGYRCAWAVECRNHSEWHVCGQRRRRVVPFWRPETVSYLTNPVVFDGATWPVEIAKAHAERAMS